ncbi:MAG: hypothetical protein OXF97_00735 [Nitrospira sp.]|nr:hypothetical protein [Nitrospira sp.]MCY3954929.1 hypothetical protein [Nitrospira sp.]MCY4132271.1 hypothetical protein [Nitrospira sp.]
MAGLILMEKPGLTQLRNFRREFSKAWSLEVLGVSYPRMQMLTVREILIGKHFQTPTVAGRKAAQPGLFG